jgi:hypothetical protein
LLNPNSINYTDIDNLFIPLILIYTNNLILTKIKDTKLTIKNGAIINISKDIEFDKMYNIFGKLSSKQSFMSNPRFGVLDIETYKDLDGLSKVYSMGYSIYKEEHPNTFFNRH